MKKIEMSSSGIVEIVQISRAYSKWLKNNVLAANKLKLRTLKDVQGEVALLADFIRIKIAEKARYL